MQQLSHHDFVLHPRLAQDTFDVCELPLCSLRLMNDCRFPWLILVPRRAEITELFQLTADDQQQWLKESHHVSLLLQQYFHPDKLNIAALGNQVPQFHWHIIARFRHDCAWPGPVWGYGDAKAYKQQEAEALLASLRQQLTGMPLLSQQPNQKVEG